MTATGRLEALDGRLAVDLPLVVSSLKVRRTNRRETLPTDPDGPARDAELAFHVIFDAQHPLGGGDPSRMAQRMHELFHLDGADGAAAPVRFVWGSVSFEGRLATLSETQELFSPDGRLLRTRFAVTVRQGSEVSEPAPIASPRGEVAGGPAGRWVNGVTLPVRTSGTFPAGDGPSAQSADGSADWRPDGSFEGRPRGSADGTEPCGPRPSWDPEGAEWERSDEEPESPRAPLLGRSWGRRW